MMNTQESKVDQNRTCLIITGGSYCPHRGGADLVIACDAGYAYCDRMGITPNVILGDFDSIDSNVKLPDDVLRYPVRKDETDTQIAARYAIEHGYGHITVTCAMGGRFDHTFANLQTAAFIVERGGICVLEGVGDRITCFSGCTQKFEPIEGYALSVFAISDRCSGVTIENASYEVTDCELTNTFPLGCSNHYKQGPAVISCKSGILAVVESDMQGKVGLDH